MRAILLHPHPDMGGNQHNNVVAALFGAVDGAVRFDFASSDLGVAKQQVLDQLDAIGRSWLVGYSFGGGVAALVDDPRVQGWFLIAPALALVTPVIAADPRPKHVLAAANDRFFSADALRQATHDWTATTHDTVIGADHFFVGHEPGVAARCTVWLASHDGIGGAVTSR